MSTLSRPALKQIRRRPRRDSEADVSPESEAASAARTAASAGAATRARWLLDRAHDAKVILKRIRKVPVDGTDEWLKRAATETLQKRGPNGASGALGQFRGHLFEHLDARDYKLRNARAGRVLTLRTKAHAPGYDASRFIHGRFAGAVQHKLSASGVLRAAEKLNARKPGSATRATLRVPKDQAAAATRKVAGRMQVEASNISTSTIKRQGDAGLRRLASRGSAATSSVNQFTRGVGFAALSGMALGSLGDARKLHRRELSAHEFAARRGMDASEGAVSTVAGVAATAGVTAGLSTLATGTGRGSRNRSNNCRQRDCAATGDRRRDWCGGWLCAAACSPSRPRVGRRTGEPHYVPP